MHAACRQAGGVLTDVCERRELCPPPASSLLGAADGHDETTRAVQDCPRALLQSKSECSLFGSQPSAPAQTSASP